MCIDPTLDVQLVRAIREGAGVLPDDLERLLGYMRLIAGLLEEKANELEPSWEAACVTAREIETLQGLAATVAERSITVAADTLTGILSKVAIWKALGDPEEGEAEALRDRLILSIEDDLQRLALLTTL